MVSHDMWRQGLRMMRVLRVGGASPQVPLLSSESPFSSPTFSHPACHRGSSPTTTLTSGAGQSTSTGKNLVVGETPVLLLYPLLGTVSDNPCTTLSLPSIPLRSQSLPSGATLSFLDPPPFSGPQTSSLLLLTMSSPASFFSSGRSLEGAPPAGVWPCFAQSPYTGEQQTPSSTVLRSCLVRSPGGT